MCLIYPSYFPSVANYIVLAQNQNICFEIQDNYQKQTYRNRCYIYASNGRLGLHIPVHYTQNNRQKTQEIIIDNSTAWKSVHWKSIESAYKTSPFFEFYQDGIKPLFKNKVRLLLPFVWKCFETINRCIEFDLVYKTSNAFEKETEVNDFRSLINPQKKVLIHPTPYYQVFQSKHHFIPNLSILDLLFNMGPETLEFLKKHPPLQPTSIKN